MSYPYSGYPYSGSPASGIVSPVMPAPAMASPTMSATGSPVAGSTSSGSSASSGQHGAQPFFNNTERLKVNLQLMKYYAMSLTLLMAIFIAGHWIRRLASRASRYKVLSPFVAVSRVVRRRFLRTFPGFTSVGHAVLVATYVLLNIIFTFIHIDYSKLNNFSARLGWMTASNLTLLVFLSLKNTPLAILSSYSYERINCLHQIAGYTTMVDVIIHSSTFATYILGQGRAWKLRESMATGGIIAGFAMLSLVVTATLVRRRNYELFYVIHVTMFMIIITAAAIHRSLISDRLIVVILTAASLWFYDRLFRLARLAYHSINNNATVYPLPNGGTRIVLKKSISSARAGKHCYIWLPHIRAFETHPFTIVSTEPMELVVNRYSGFTKDLHDYACANPGGKLKASLHGPYGTFPDASKFDRVLLIAGGSGATFALGMIASTLHKLAPNSRQQIDVVWVARDRQNVSWFSSHLRTILSHENANKVLLKLHLTRFSRDSITPSVFRKPSVISDKASELFPDTIPINGAVEMDVLAPRAPLDSDDKTTLVDGLSLPVVYGRPDLDACIRRAVACTAPGDRILVAACGPTGLVEAVRNTTAECISADGPGVELHLEQFGW